MDAIVGGNKGVVCGKTGGAVAAGEVDGAGVAGEEVAEVVHGPDGEFEGLACGDGRLNEVCGVIGPEDAVAGDATDGNGIAGRRDRGTGGAGGGDGAGGGQGRLEDMDAIVGGNKGVVVGRPAALSLLVKWTVPV